MRTIYFYTALAVVALAVSMIGLPVSDEAIARCQEKTGQTAEQCIIQLS